MSSIFTISVRRFSITRYTNTLKICLNRTKSLWIVNPVLSTKSMRILQWNGILLLKFTLFSSMLQHYGYMRNTSIYHIITRDLKLIDSNKKLNKNLSCIQKRLICFVNLSIRTCVHLLAPIQSALNVGDRFWARENRRPKN